MFKVEYRGSSGKVVAEAIEKFQESLYVLSVRTEDKYCHIQGGTFYNSEHGYGISLSFEPEFVNNINCRDSDSFDETYNSSAYYFSEIIVYTNDVDLTSCLAVYPEKNKYRILFGDPLALYGSNEHVDFIIRE